MVYTVAVHVVGEGEASFLAYLASLESDSHFLRYSATLSVLEYILSDIKKSNPDVFLNCLDSLSERAIADMASWHEYSEEYRRTLFFGIFQSFNTRHLEMWDKNGSHAYSSVSVYVAKFLSVA